MKNALIILFGLAILLTSCGKEGTALQPETAKADPNIVVVTNLDNTLMIKLVNDKRVAGCTCGTTVMPPVPSLTWNNLLAAAASAHSKDMATNNFFAHESSNGKTVVDRYAAVGYKWISLAENIASGQTSEQTVIEAWLASEGHCKNMMSANVKEMGAAREGKYWTQDFGAR